MKITRKGLHRLLDADGAQVSQHTDTFEAFEKAAALGDGTYTLHRAPVEIVVGAAVAEPATQPPAPTAPAPVPEPPPPAPAPPPVTPSGDIPQGITHDGATFGGRDDSDAPCGPSPGTLAMWNRRLSLPWRRGPLGDFIDADGVENGPRAFSTAPVVAGASVVVVDVTDLARRWQSDNRGAYIVGTGTDFPLIFKGRSSDQPPVLFVTADGVTHAVQARANACWSKSSANVISSSAEWRLQRNGGVAILQFHDMPPGNITDARIEAQCSAERAGGVALFAADPPPIFVPSERAPLPGLRAEVGSFAGLAGHPEVLFSSDGSEGGPLDHGFKFAREFVNGPDGPEIVSGWLKPTATMPDTRTSLDNRLNTVDGVEEAPDASAPGLRGFVPEVVRDSQFVQLAFSLGPDWGSEVDACKVFGVQAQWGYWNWVGYWQNIVGNGGAKANGLKQWYTPNNGQPPTWIYNGPSIRFLVGKPGLEADSPYRDLFPVADYVYTVDQVGPFPPGQGFRVLLRRGDHYLWDIELRQNSITAPFDALGNGQGQKDGVLRVWINGHLAHERSDLMLRRHPQMGTHGLWLDAFHGGQSSVNRDMPRAYQVGAVTIANQLIGT